MDLVTNLQSPKQVVPAIATFHHPTACFVPWILPSLLLLLAARLDVGDVPPPRCRAANLGIVVALVVAQVLAHLFRRGSRNDQRLQRLAEHLHIVPVCARERDRQRDAVRVGEHVSLGAQFTPICRVFSGLVPPLTGADTVALSIDWNRQSMPWRSS